MVDGIGPRRCVVVGGIENGFIVDFDMFGFGGRWGHFDNGDACAARSEVKSHIAIVGTTARKGHGLMRKWEEKTETRPCRPMSPHDHIIY